MRVSPAQPATDQSHGQFPGVKHNPYALPWGKPAQQAHLLQIYWVKAIGRLFVFIHPLLSPATSPRSASCSPANARAGSVKLAPANSAQ